LTNISTPGLIAKFRHLIKRVIMNFLNFPNYYLLYMSDLHICQMIFRHILTSDSQISRSSFTGNALFTWRQHDIIGPMNYKSFGHVRMAAYSLTVRNMSTLK
jgi:hypothetical protein